MAVQGAARLVVLAPWSVHRLPAMAVWLPVAAAEPAMLQSPATAASVVMITITAVVVRAATRPQPEPAAVKGRSEARLAAAEQTLADQALLSAVVAMP